MTELTSVLISALSILLSLAVILTLALERRRDRKGTDDEGDGKNSGKLVEVFDSLEEIVVDFEKFGKRVKTDIREQQAKSEHFVERIASLEQEIELIREKLGEIAGGKVTKSVEYATPKFQAPSSDNENRASHTIYDTPTAAQTAQYQTPIPLAGGQRAAGYSNGQASHAGAQVQFGNPVPYANDVGVSDIIGQSSSAYSGGAMNPAVEIPPAAPVKRGRGRPRKNPIPEPPTHVPVFTNEYIIDAKPIVDIQVSTEPMKHPEPKKEEESLMVRLAREGNATNTEIMRLLRAGVSVDEISTQLHRNKGEILLIQALLKTN